MALFGLFGKKKGEAIALRRAAPGAAAKKPARKLIPQEITYE